MNIIPPSHFSSFHFVCAHCLRKEWLKVGWVAIALIALPCCKKESNSKQQEKSSVAIQTIPIRTNPEFPSRPSAHLITPAQKAFWDYIETFNRLPDNPTEVQKEIFATRGVAPRFKIISTSPKSLFSDVNGMMAHRKLFAERYPWVKRLLEAEQITLEVDASIYQGTTKEIIDKHYKKVAWDEDDYFQPKGNRTVFTKRWLESLLVIDYIFAYGSEQDRIDGMLILTETFETVAHPSDNATGRVERGRELEIPASFEIAIAIANQFPEHVPEQLINFLPILPSSPGQIAFYIDYLKWSRRVESFKKWENLMTLHEVQVGNYCVQNEMLHYTIYWYHLHEKVRPNPGSSGLAIKALFKRIYGNDEGLKEHKKYLALLDAAYPAPPKLQTPTKIK